MQWYGKSLGGLIGFILARQVGAVVGVLMGHVVDEDGGKFFRRTLSWLEGLAHEPDPIDNAYRVLGVAPSASDDEVKIAYRRLMNENGGCPNFLPKCYSGGAPVAPSLTERFQTRFGTYIHNIYGLTESASPTHAVPMGARIEIA